MKNRLEFSCDCPLFTTFFLFSTVQIQGGPAPGGGEWSGEATRHTLGSLGSGISVTFEDQQQQDGGSRTVKERPIWMTESTITPSIKTKSGGCDLIVLRATARRTQKGIKGTGKVFPTGGCRKLYKESKLHEDAKSTHFDPTPLTQAYTIQEV